MLFVIAMEGLSILMKYAEMEGKVMGLEKKDCSVNHILFADEVMLFLKVNAHYVKKIEGVLKMFGRASGLQPNMQKSKSVSKVVRSKSKFKEGVLPIKYLRVPLHSRNLLKCHFQTIVDKIKRIGFSSLSTLS